MKLFFKTVGVVIGIVWFACSSWSHATYQQQGFATFQEADNAVSFTCDAQCFMIVGPVGSYDLLSIKWTLHGNGQVWLGFLVGQQIFPGELLTAEGVTQHSFIFSLHPAFTQLPKGQVQIVFIVNGAVSATSLSVIPMRLSFWQKISQGWRDFWTNETLRPYSINLRYGVTILGTSLVKITYRLFFIGVLCCIIFIRKPTQRKQAIMILAIILVLLFTLRNLLNRTDWTKSALHSYTSAPEDQKGFFDLADYPVFINKMRKTLKLDEQFKDKVCTIYFDAAQEWPFKAHADVFYSEPCQAATDKSAADYIAYYKKPIGSESEGKPVLLEFNWSFLIQNK